MHRQASFAVALGGSVAGSRFLTMSDIILMIRPYGRVTEFRFSVEIYRSTSFQREVRDSSNRYDMPDH
jgi:hypothetical protein